MTTALPVHAEEVDGTPIEAENDAPVVDTYQHVGMQLDDNPEAKVSITPQNPNANSVLVRISVFNAQQLNTVYVEGAPTLTTTPGSSISATVLAPIKGNSINVYADYKTDVRIEQLAAFQGNKELPGSLLPTTPTLRTTGINTLSTNDLTVGITGAGDIPATDVRAVFVSAVFESLVSTQLTFDDITFNIHPGKNALSTVVVPNEQGTINVHTPDNANVLFNLWTRGYVTGTTMGASAVNLAGSMVPTFEKLLDNEPVSARESKLATFSSPSDTEFSLSLVSGAGLENSELTTIQVGNDAGEREQGAVFDPNIGLQPQLIVSKPGENNATPVKLHEGKGNLTIIHIADFLKKDVNALLSFEAPPEINIETPKAGENYSFKDHGGVTISGTVKTQSYSLQKVVVSAISGNTSNPTRGGEPIPEKTANDQDALQDDGSATRVEIGTAQVVYTADGLAHWTIDTAPPRDGNWTFEVKAFTRADTFSTADVTANIIMPKSNEVVISKNAFVVGNPNTPSDHKACGNVLGLGDTWVLFDTAECLKLGMVLTAGSIANAPQGFIRKIRTIDQTPDGYMIMTDPALITDAILQVNYRSVINAVNYANQEDLDNYQQQLENVEGLSNVSVKKENLCTNGKGYNNAQDSFKKDNNVTYEDTYDNTGKLTKSIRNGEAISDDDPFGAEITPTDPKYYQTPDQNNADNSDDTARPNDNSDQGVEPDFDNSTDSTDVPTVSEAEELGVDPEPVPGNSFSEFNKNLKTPDPLVASCGEADFSAIQNKEDLNEVVGGDTNDPVDNLSDGGLMLSSARPQSDSPFNFGSNNTDQGVVTNYCVRLDFGKIYALASGAQFESLDLSSKSKSGEFGEATTQIEAGINFCQTIRTQHYKNNWLQVDLDLRWDFWNMRPWAEIGTSTTSVTETTSDFSAFILARLRIVFGQTGIEFKAVDGDLKKEEEPEAREKFRLMGLNFTIWAGPVPVLLSFNIDLCLRVEIEARISAGFKKVSLRTCEGGWALNTKTGKREINNNGDTYDSKTEFTEGRIQARIAFRAFIMCTLKIYDAFQIGVGVGIKLSFEFGVLFTHTIGTKGIVTYGEANINWTLFALFMIGLQVPILHKPSVYYEQIMVIFQGDIWRVRFGNPTYIRYPGRAELTTKDMNSQQLTPNQQYLLVDNDYNPIPLSNSLEIGGSYIPNLDNHSKWDDDFKKTFTQNVTSDLDKDVCSLMDPSSPWFMSINGKDNDQKDDCRDKHTISNELSKYASYAYYKTTPALSQYSFADGVRRLVSESEITGDGSTKIRDFRLAYSPNAVAVDPNILDRELNLTQKKLNTKEENLISSIKKDYLDIQDIQGKAQQQYELLWQAWKDLRGYLDGLAARGIDIYLVDGDMNIPGLTQNERDELNRRQQNYKDSENYFKTNKYSTSYKAFRYDFENHHDDFINEFRLIFNDANSAAGVKSTNKNSINDLNVPDGSFDRFAAMLGLVPGDPKLTAIQSDQYGRIDIELLPAGDYKLVPLGSVVEASHGLTPKRNAFEAQSANDISFKIDEWTKGSSFGDFGVGKDHPERVVRDVPQTGSAAIKVTQKVRNVTRGESFHEADDAHPLLYKDGDEIEYQDFVDYPKYVCDDGYGSYSTCDKGIDYENQRTLSNVTINSKIEGNYQTIDKSSRVPVNAVRSTALGGDDAQFITTNDKGSDFNLDNQGFSYTMKSSNSDENSRTIIPGTSHTFTYSIKAVGDQTKTKLTSSTHITFDGQYASQDDGVPSAYKNQFNAKNAAIISTVDWSTVGKNVVPEKFIQGFRYALCVHNDSTGSDDCIESDTDPEKIESTVDISTSPTVLGKAFSPNFDPETKQLVVPSDGLISVAYLPVLGDGYTYVLHETGELKGWETNANVAFTFQTDINGLYKKFYDIQIDYRVEIDTNLQIKNLTRNQGLPESDWKTYDSSNHYIPIEPGDELDVDLEVSVPKWEYDENGNISNWRNQYALLDSSLNINVNNMDIIYDESAHFDGSGDNGDTYPAKEQNARDYDCHTNGVFGNYDYRNTYFYDSVFATNYYDWHINPFKQLLLVNNEHKIVPHIEDNNVNRNSAQVVYDYVNNPANYLDLIGSDGKGIYTGNSSNLACHSPFEDPYDPDHAFWEYTQIPDVFPGYYARNEVKDPEYSRKPHSNASMSIGKGMHESFPSLLNNDYLTPCADIDEESCTESYPGTNIKLSKSRIGGYVYEASHSKETKLESNKYMQQNSPTDPSYYYYPIMNALVPGDKQHFHFKLKANDNLGGTEGTSFDYNITGDKNQVQVGVNSVDFYQGSFSNTAIQIDSKPNVPVTGVKYQLFNTDQEDGNDRLTDFSQIRNSQTAFSNQYDSDSQTFTTDKDGKINLRYLEYGSYALKRVGSPDNYVQDESNIRFTAYDGAYYKNNEDSSCYPWDLFCYFIQNRATQYTLNNPSKKFDFTDDIRYHPIFEKSDIFENKTRGTEAELIKPAVDRAGDPDEPEVSELNIKAGDKMTLRSTLKYPAAQNPGPAYGTTISYKLPDELKITTDFDTRLPNVKTIINGQTFASEYKNGEIKIGPKAGEYNPGDKKWKHVDDVCYPNPLGRNQYCSEGADYYYDNLVYPDDEIAIDVGLEASEDYVGNVTTDLSFLNNYFNDDFREYHTIGDEYYGKLNVEAIANNLMNKAIDSTDTPDNPYTPTGSFERVAGVKYALEYDNDAEEQVFVSNEPIPDQAYSATADYDGFVLTDENGNLEVDYLEAGNYCLREIDVQKPWKHTEDYKQCFTISDWHTDTKHLAAKLTTVVDYQPVFKIETTARNLTRETDFAHDLVVREGDKLQLKFAIDFPSELNASYAYNPDLLAEYVDGYDVDDDGVPEELHNVDGLICSTDYLELLNNAKYQIFDGRVALTPGSSWEVTCDLDAAEAKNTNFLVNLQADYDDTSWQDVSLIYPATAFAEVTDDNGEPLADPDIKFQLFDGGTTGDYGDLDISNVYQEGDDPANFDYEQIRQHLTRDDSLLDAEYEPIFVSNNIRDQRHAYSLNVDADGFITPDQNGHIEFNYLPEGNYVLKQIRTSLNNYYAVEGIAFTIGPKGDVLSYHYVDLGDLQQKDIGKGHILYAQKLLTDDEYDSDHLLYMTPDDDVNFITELVLPPLLSEGSINDLQFFVQKPVGLESDSDLEFDEISDQVISSSTLTQYVHDTDTGTVSEKVLQEGVDYQIERVYSAVIPASVAEEEINDPFLNIIFSDDFAKNLNHDDTRIVLDYDLPAPLLFKGHDSVHYTSKSIVEVNTKPLYSNPLEELGALYRPTDNSDNSGNGSGINTNIGNSGANSAATGAIVTSILIILAILLLLGVVLLRRRKRISGRGIRN